MSQAKIRIVSVIGARPNFMKISPLVKALKKYEAVDHTIIHTGQHYDGKMARVFFEELKLPRPDMDLAVAPGPQAAQTAEIMQKFDQVLNLIPKPAVVVVVGDVNSTIACGLTTVKRGIPLAHIEAGLRSYNWEMPEEINRVLTDRLSDALFTTERSANENLTKEGISPEKIYFVGNVMIDTLMANRSIARQSSILSDLGLSEKTYAVLTLHRAESVDHPEILERLLRLCLTIQEKLPIVWPIHPRTRSRLEQHPLGAELQAAKNIKIIDPLGYLEFLCLMDRSRFVLTDSGGIQEETTVLDVDCITLRGETERPVTVEQGTNTVVGTDPDKVLNTVNTILSGQGKSGQGLIPELWDGRAADRIAEILVKKYGS